MNTTLKATQALLLKQINSLSLKLDTITDVTAAQKITMEVQEMVHRLNIVQNLIFTKDSATLGAALPAIQIADGQLSNAIQKIDNISAFISATGTFLACVDQAIDLAKTIV